MILCAVAVVMLTHRPVLYGQAHTLLLCQTRVVWGVLSVRTAAGEVSVTVNVSSLTYSSNVNSVSPTTWNTAGQTIVELQGRKYVLP